MISRALTSLACLAGLFLPAAPRDGAVADSGTPLEDQVYQSIQELRARDGRPALVRSDELDGIAGRRAREIAVAPAERRLPPARPLDALLAGSPEAAHRTLAELIEIQEHVAEPAAAAARAWRRHEPSLELIVAPQTQVAGVGSARGADGALVIVVVLGGRALEPADLAGLERLTEREINRIRREAGLRPLRPLPALRDVARGHSEDMARRGFFDHQSPDGRSPGDRVRAGGVAFRIVAENIGASHDLQDPVSAIVDGWLHSPGHYENLIGSQFTHTGVGAALNGDGTVYLTQLFVRRTTDR